MTRQTRTAIVVGAAVIAMLMGLEMVAQASARRAAQMEPASWGTYIDRVDEALTARDISHAEVAAHDAYTSALVSHGWDGLIAAGDAYRRIADVSGFQSADRAKARQAYLSAFFRARNEKSVDGVARSAQAFTELGDRQVAAQCLRAARRLVMSSNDPHARERVSVLVERTSGYAGGLETAQAR